MFPRRNNDKLLKEVLDDEEKLMKITYKYPTSLIKLKRVKSSYFEVINSLSFPDCNEALKRICNQQIDIDKIKAFIQNQLFIED